MGASFLRFLISLEHKQHLSFDLSSLSVVMVHGVLPLLLCPEVGYIYLRDLHHFRSLGSYNPGTPVPLSLQPDTTLGLSFSV